MDLEELICLTNSGIIRVRTTRVRVTIARVHDTPESAPKSGAQRPWKNTISPEIAQYRGCIIADSNPYRLSQMDSGTKRSII